MLRARLATNLVFNLVAAGWVLHDAWRRRARKPIFAAALAVLWGPLGIAFWCADRPLADGERRAGGTAWTMARGFLLAWAGLLPAVYLLAGPVVADNTPVPGSLGERFGETAATCIVTAAVWGGPALLALVLGRAMRTPGALEHGASARLRRSLPVGMAIALAGLSAMACAVVMR